MAYAPSKQRRLKRQEAKELNLIPIMNLFIVVIPMLMTIMVTVPLAMNEISLSSGGSTSSKSTENTLKNIKLSLFADGFGIEVEGEEDIIEIPLQEDGSYDFKALNQQLSALKELNQDQKNITVAPDNNVLYDILLSSIDICKLNDFPVVKYKGRKTGYYRAN